MTNPYQPFFEKLDETVAALEASKQPEQYVVDAIDLLRRAAYVLANQLNMQAQVYQTLFLEPPEPEVVPGEVEDTAETAPAEPQEASS